MPKSGERVIPITVSGESNADLKKIIDNTGLLQSDVLRYAVTAALKTLAERDSVSLPIKFNVSLNGEHKKK